MILYFTGTGNSRFAAKQLGSFLDDTVVAINDYMHEKKDGYFSSEKPYVFVVPSYMSRMPLPVEDFLNNSSFSGNKNAYFVFTAGMCVGNAYKYCQKLCTSRGLMYQGTTSVLMAASYVALYDVMPKEQAADAAKSVIPALKEISEKIKQGQPVTANPAMKGHKAFSALSPLSTALLVTAKPFHASDACIGCGKCESLCPLSNIHLDNQKPVWGKDCMHCMACISACPTKAIDYGKKTANRNRYYLEDC